MLDMLAGKVKFHIKPFVIDGISVSILGDITTNNSKYTTAKDARKYAEEKVVSCVRIFVKQAVKHGLKFEKIDFLDDVELHYDYITKLPTYFIAYCNLYYLYEIRIKQGIGYNTVKTFENYQELREYLISIGLCNIVDLYKYNGYKGNYIFDKPYYEEIILPTNMNDYMTSIREALYIHDEEQIVSSFIETIYHSNQEQDLLDDEYIDNDMNDIISGDLNNNIE